MTGSLADKAYKVLKDDVITCSLEPGQQIVQAQLSDTYDFGATPIREALQRLEQEGFVEAIPRFGYIVSPITFRDVREIYELRSIIEASAARLAATRGSQDQLKKLLDGSEFLYEYGDKESYSRFLSRNIDFHLSVAVAAGNQRMVDLLSRLLEEMTRIFHLGLNLKDSGEEMRDEHIALAQALVDRDPDRAEQIVKSQIETSQARVLEALTQYKGLEIHQGLGATIQVKPSNDASSRESK
jgi:DNA-binding GntR family transcriptional regulator